MKSKNHRLITKGFGTLFMLMTVHIQAQSNIHAQSSLQTQSNLSQSPPKSTTSMNTGQPITYPETRRAAVTDEYHGRQIADPYRWLEDVESEDVGNWVEAQNEITQNYLKNLPSREPMQQRLTKLWDYERTGLPSRRDDQIFFTHNDGLQNQSLLYVLATDDDRVGEVAPHESARVLLDPNKLSEDGTVALGSWHPSDNGRLLAYSVADGGSDWRTWRVRDVATGKDLSDVLEWSKFSGVAWTADNKGFYYARYAEPQSGEELTGTNDKQMLYLHRLGTSQSDDELVFARPDEPKWGFSPSVTDDGRYLVIGNWKGTEPKTQVWIQDLEKPGSEVRGLVLGFDADFQFIGSLDSRLYFLTDHQAPRRRVIAIEVADFLANPTTESLDRANWIDVIDQTNDVLEDVSLIGGVFYASYLSDALSKVVRFDLNGQALGNVALPAKGAVAGFHGRHDATETYFSFTNYVTPPSIFRVDAATGEFRLWTQPDVAFQVDQYVTEQVFCQSKDGTQVPILITRHRDTVANGQNRTLLYAYGGFNISLTPSYSPAIAAWLESGGIYAVANLRGGGEYGRQWHEDGMRLKKQNVFDDFIAAAEHLIAMKLTNPQSLGIRGGSNGGLLVGAVMTQRPELFGACLPAVGVMDMLRYHKFTIGWAWVTEFGSSDEADQIDNLISYSPLHNVREGTCYPATMVTTADRDDRVVPGHSFKFAAALQAAQNCEQPTLIRIETRAGHGAGTPTSKKIEEYADLWSFLIDNLQGN